jgi:Ketosteroid isomerase-related protein
MDLLHDDFEFEFMGICEICQKYNKETYESVWLGKVIPEVLPNGIDINIYQRIADGDMVVYMVKGKATAINGEYNNNYAMVMRLKDEKIIFFQEYMSDLLAETRLHMKKIVDIE